VLTVRGNHVGELMATDTDRGAGRAAFGHHLRELARRTGLSQSQLLRALDREGHSVPKGTFSAWWWGHSTPQREDVVRALVAIFEKKRVPRAEIRLLELYEAANQRSEPGQSGQPAPARPPSNRPPPGQPFRTRRRRLGWMTGLITVLLLGSVGAWWLQTRGSRSEFDHALGQLESPDVSVRHRAVQTIQELAPRSATDLAQACGQLASLIQTHNKPLSSDSPMSQVPALQDRSPDAQAAIQALSQLRCVSQPGGVRLNEVDLRKAQLPHTYFPGGSITWSDLRQLRFSEARLQGARLVGSNLDYANLEAAQLTDADLRGARMEGVRLRQANLQRADLGAELTSGRRVYLGAADLTGADLRGANLRTADLSGGKGIESATLRNTHLEGAQLQDAVLGGVALDGATADASTEWPAGFDPVAAGVKVTP
jgi:uncharacterized protein YjbI with pentapeptide repeats